MVHTYAYSFIICWCKVRKETRQNKIIKEAWYETMLLGYENKGYCCFILQIL